MKKMEETYRNFRLRMKHRAWVALTLPLFLLAACQEKIDWDLDLQNNLKLVVEGKITDEVRAHEVKLTLPVFEINGEPEPVSGARVRISDGDSIYELAEDPARSGVYLTDPWVKGDTGKIYTLNIQVENFECWGVAGMSPVSDIKTPSYYRAQSDPALYRFINSGNNDIPNLLRLELDWSAVPGYDTLDEDDNHAIIYMYSFGPLNVDANQVFAPNHEQVLFPPGTLILATKESLSEGYAEYLRGLLSETSWNGGFFDVRPGDPFTNLSEGAIGYFSVCGVKRDTVIFNP